MKNGRTLCYLLPPLLTGAVLLLIFSLFSLYPFGDRTVVWCDLKQQSIPLLAVFRSIFADGNSLLFSFSQAGGSGIFPALCFFVFSPFSLLSLFFEPEGLPYAANLMLVFKLSAAALCAAVFFRAFFPKLSLLQGSALPVMYALCGFALQYFQTLTWLDTLMVFPLLLVSLHRLLIQRRPLAFILLLAYTMVTGFYLSIMTVLFLIFAVLFSVPACLPKKERSAAAVRFVFSGITAALLAMPVLLPSLHTYLGSARSDGTWEKLTTAGGMGDLYTKLPLLMCGAVVVPLLFCYAFHNGKTAGDNPRRFLPLLTLLMIIPFFVERINMVWHMGSYQAFPCRFSYITTLLLLSLSAEALSAGCCKPLEDSMVSGVNPSSQHTAPLLYRLRRSLSVLLPMALTGTVLLFAVQLFRRHKTELTRFSRTLWGNESSFSYLLLAFLFFALCWTLLLALRRRGMISRKIFSLFFAALCVVECGFNSAVYLGNINGGEQEWQRLFAVSEEIGTLQGKKEEDGNLFFRVKTRSKLFDVNWLAAAGHPSLGHYTSLTGKDYLYSLKQLGYSGYWMEIGSHGGSLFTDGLLCHQYLVEDNYSVTENEYFQPLGLFLSRQPAETLSQVLTRPALQNQIYRELYDADTELFTEYQPTSLSGAVLTAPSEGNEKYRLTLEGKEGTIRYSVHIADRQLLYFDCFDALSTKLTEPINDSFSVTVNGEVVAESYPTKKENGLLFLGAFEDEDVEIELKLFKKLSLRSFGVFGLDSALLSAEAPAHAAITTEKRSLTGSFTAEEDGWLMIQLPYDKGFTAAVNGVKTDIRRAYGTFMAIPVSKGENRLSLTFYPYGMRAGWGLFAVGIAAAALLSSERLRNRLVLLRNGKITAWVISIIAFGFFTAAVSLLLLVYLISLLL